MNREEYQKKWIEKTSIWDTHIERIKASDLSNDQKQHVIDSFNKIRETFGENWLGQIVSDRKHPLLYEILNLAPWTRFKLADFGDKLVEAKEIKNFYKLKQRLMSARDYYAAEAEFEILIMLKRAGLEVEIPHESGKKIPDILAKIDGKEVCFEVTTMRDAYEWQAAFKTLNALTFPFFPDFEIEFTGKIHRILSTPRRKELIEKLKIAAQKAKIEKIPVEVSEPGLIDFLFVPKGLHSEIQKWLQLKGFHGGIQGPPVHVDEVKRIKRAIYEKAKQIPKDKPGVIVVFDSHLTTGLERGTFAHVVYQVEEDVYEHPNLLGAIIISSLITGEKPSEIIEDENFFFISKTSYEILCHNILIIRNKYSNFEELGSILDIFKA